MSDQGDGTYRNPVLYADYSDPDMVRVGRDFHMTASSFNASPGLLPNLLPQKFSAPEFIATTKLTFTPRADEDRTGLLIMGSDNAWMGLRARGDTLALVQATCLGADVGGDEKEIATQPCASTTIYLRARVTTGARVQFAFSGDG